jgi:hypothetical protein
MANQYTPKARFCTNCGARVKIHETYCPICGNRLDDDDRNPGEYIVYEYNSTAESSGNAQYYTSEQSSHAGKIISIIGSCLVAVSVFLPYASFKILGYGDSLSLINDESGIMLLVVSLIGLLLWSVNSNVLSSLSAIAVCYITFRVNAYTTDIFAEMGIMAGFVGKEIGFYMMVIGSVMVAIGTLVNFFEKVSGS